MPVNYPTLHFRYSHDLSNVLSLRLIGIKAREGIVYWKPVAATPLLVALMAPFVIWLATFKTEPVPHELIPGFAGWLVYFCAAGLILLPAVALAGAKLFHGLTPDLEEMLTVVGRRAYDRWADTWTAMFPQVIFCSIFAAGSGFALHAASSSPGSASTLFVGSASYVSVVVSGFLVAAGAYWSVGGTMLAYQLSAPGRLRLSPFSPVSTPGMELLARYYRLGFYVVSLGFAVCLVPVLSWAYASPDSQQLSLVKYAIFGVSAGSSLFIGILPQWFLSRAVARERRIAFAEVSAQLDGMTPQKDRSFQLMWLQTLTSSRTTTMSESAIVGILLGTATALAPLIWHVVRGS